ncbi:secondary thiamine-phosphate synthase enzyme YjbQ [Pendulispora albinea]|uniref:Secondary thiamine-phosphate synthase enzyme YjbQ n=1 Tax=Pendulispora albinea TaxID=2741071 RepID=A0ABZ2MCN4_9BACT
MKIHNDVIEVRTKGRGFYDVTREVARVVGAAGVGQGLCTVFVQHTSASLVIQENADPAVLRDLEKWMSRLAPESDTYEHDDEGPDDMPAHLRGAITRTSESIPVIDGRLCFGTWQALYVWEHRRHPHTRRLAVSVIGQ